MAFLAPSYGIYYFPADEAVRIALGTVLTTLPRTPQIEQVVFACLDDAMSARYDAEMRRRQAPPSKPV